MKKAKKEGILKKLEHIKDKNKKQLKQIQDQEKKQLYANSKSLKLVNHFQWLGPVAK